MAEKFISREKLGKKARKALDAGQRIGWNASPVTRIVESKKIYSRKKRTRDRYDDSGPGSFFACFRILNGRSPDMSGSSAV